MSPRTLLALAATTAAALGAAALPAAATAQEDRTLSGYGPGGGRSAPLVFGHRGASGYRPEHTLPSYSLAAQLGADVIEPDLVVTKDDQLVARHEPTIRDTTDVADRPEFASRRTTKTIDGVEYRDDWFTEDFTLAELKTLRAKERLPAVRQQNTIYDGRYTIPTFQEVLDLRERLARREGRRIAVAPETKHPTYFASQGHDIDALLVAALRRNGLTGRRAPVYVQSFEVGNLQRLNRRIDVPLVQLSSTRGAPFDTTATGSGPTYDEMETPAGLRAIKRYADVAGPDYQQILPRQITPPATNGPSLAPTSFVADAHAAGLDVVPYTVRAENQFLPTDLQRGTDPTAFGDVLTLLGRLYDQRIDGIFADQPDIAVTARDER